MKKHFLRAISCLLITLLLGSCLIPVAYATEDEIARISFRKGKNDVSASYKAGKYYNHLTSIPYTQDNVTDVLAVALSQLGYMESDVDQEFSGVVAGSDNYTEYNYNMGDFGVGYGGVNYDWCASFVSFCLLQSHSTDQNSMNDWCRYHVADENDAKYDPDFADYIWREVGCQRWANNLISAGYYEKSAAKGGDYVPKSGDLIFYRWSPEKSIGHIGIVVYSDGERVYTVEGNTSGGSTMISNGGGVYFKSYALDYSCIDGYGALPYASNEDVERIDYSGKNATEGLYITAVAKKLYANPSVESSYIDIPAFTMLEVVDVVEEGIGGMLAVSCKIDGEYVGGYMVNSADERVIQISNSVPDPAPEFFVDFDKINGFVDGGITGYTFNGEELVVEGATEVKDFARIGCKAELKFESAVVRGGYFIDNDRENITWISDSVVTEDGVAKCEITSDIYGIEFGAHSLTFIVELENTSIAVIDTLEFVFIDPAQENEGEDQEGEENTEEESEKTTEPAETEAATEAPNEAPTEAARESEIATSTEPTGCGAALGVSAFVIILSSAACILFKGRKED